MAINKVNKKNSPHFGEWRVRKQLMIDGRIVSLPVKYAKTKREAQDIERQLILDARKGFDFDGANQTLPDAFSNWIESQERANRWENSTKRSWHTAEKVVRHYCNELKLKDCNQDRMREFINCYVVEHHATASPHSTAAMILQHLRTYFLTIEGTLITKSPVPKRPLEKFFRKGLQSDPEEKYAMTDSELFGVKDVMLNDLQRLGIRYQVSRIALLIMSETGMRPQEVQAVKFSDLVEEEDHWVFKLHDSYYVLDKKMNGHLKSRRPGNWRLTPPITKSLYEVIRKFQSSQEQYLDQLGLSNPDDLICLCISDYRLLRLKQPITQRSMNDVLKKIAKQVGVQNGNKSLTCYTLRTTVGTRLARLSDYSYASDRMGNSLEVYTRYYVKPMNHGYGSLMDQYLAMNG